MVISPVSEAGAPWVGSSKVESQNARVIEKTQPQVLLELAEAYGSLSPMRISVVAGLSETSTASAVGATILPDEDPKHAELIALLTGRFGGTCTAQAHRPLCQMRSPRKC